MCGDFFLFGYIKIKNLITYDYYANTYMSMTEFISGDD